MSTYASPILDQKSPFLPSSRFPRGLLTVEVVRMALCPMWDMLRWKDSSLFRDQGSVTDDLLLM